MDLPRTSNAHPREELTLSRDLGLFTITMIGIGAMIGAGIFVLTGIAAGVAGPALMLAFLLNGVVTLFTAMAYAELGSAFPSAGGGYRWVKQALGGTWGFLSGWMDWFAHFVAGSLYALAFGRFATELWLMAGLPTFGLSVHRMSLIFMTMVVALFTYINYRGASETGLVGNVITLTKVAILAMFILFGLMAMFRTPHWTARFTDDFMPNGFGGVLVAMGLTFIAFEGYEIIAQSGEEVKSPERNIPRAIFYSIFTVVIIYVLVAFASIGSVQPPSGVLPHEYLGERKEVAIVEVARQIFPLGTGTLLLLISGLASTMSALNATTYSSSRVAFSMGREGNLPEFLGRIHPQRHTPHWAVSLSGSLMAILAWSLPIEHVAAAADIMFLLLFIMVNISVMVLRHKEPDRKRGFSIPWFPAIPILGLVTQGMLAVYLFTYSPVAWYVIAGWIGGGLLAYYAYFSKVEEKIKPKEILMEEVLVSREYSVLVPVSNQEQARVLGLIGSILAQSHGGEVLALYVARVPPQLSLADGRYFLKEGRQILERVIEQAKTREVPVHTVIRLGRNVAEAVRKTAIENASNFIVMGWPGRTETPGRIFGSVIDPILSDPPADMAVVRCRAYRPLHSILVPVGGDPNSRLAARVAVAMARVGEFGPVRVTLLHVVPPRAGKSALVRAEQAFDHALEGIHYEHIERRVVEGINVVETVLKEIDGHDLVVIGATSESLFRNILVGSVSERIARESPVTVIMVKRRSSALRSFLRQTVLGPPTAR